MLRSLVGSEMCIRDRSLVDSSPLKPEILKDVDFIIIRELTSGLYFGEPKKRWEDKGMRIAVDTLKYD